MSRDRLAFACAVGLVWAAIGPARLAASALRDVHMLGTFVGVAFAGVAVLFGLGIARMSEKPPWRLFLATAVAGLFLFTRWTLPEERFHLVLYPALGWLAWRAAGGDGSRRGLVALVLVTLAGLGDELLQGLHVDRQFDWMDVLANMVGGSVVPLTLMGGRIAWAAPALLALTAIFFHPLQTLLGKASPAAVLLPAASVPTFPAAPSLERDLAEVPVNPEALYSGHNLVIITIDALRADHVPPMGGAPVATPTLDAFAASSRALTQGWAASSWTSPSMVSMFSALHPAVHGINVRGLNIAPGATLPLETLARAGWKVLGHAGDPTENYRHLGIPDELNRDDEAAGLRSALATDSPVFAWVHLRDVHAPYDADRAKLDSLGLSEALPDAPILQRARTHYTVPRASFPGRHTWLKPAIRALYAAEVADADASLARVLLAIKESGEGDRTIVILTADHGEELLEGDGIGHASTTLDSVPRDVLQRIPMLVRLPDGRGAGTSNSSILRQQDLLPSLLPLLGVNHPPLSRDPQLHGVDRSGAVVGEEVLPPVDNWFVTSPCGWQCPPERRAERVAALLLDGVWSWCRFDVSAAPSCAPTFTDRIGSARELASALRTPVAH